MLIRNEQVTSKHIKQHNKFVIFIFPSEYLSLLKIALKVVIHQTDIERVISECNIYCVM